MGSRYLDRLVIAQRTLRRPLSCAGVGVHSGLQVRMRLLPAPVNAGISFLRIDLPAGQGLVQAHWSRVAGTTLCTELDNGQGARVGTVEHLMAALHACGVDNVLVELDGPEVPVLDGSAEPYMRMIRQAGTLSQAAPRRYLKIDRPVQVGDGERFAVLMPYNGLRLTAEIDFEDPAIGRQRRSLRLSRESFGSELAAARTFGLVQDIRKLQSLGLAKGGSTDNAVVVDRGRVLNPEGLRYSDEFVRHKLLDAVGDLYLAGAPILGHMLSHRPGHALTRELLGALFADRNAWSWQTDVRREQVRPTPPAARAGMPLLTANRN